MPDIARCIVMVPGVTVEMNSDRPEAPAFRWVGMVERIRQERGRRNRSGTGYGATESVWRSNCCRMTDIIFSWLNGLRRKGTSLRSMPLLASVALELVDIMIVRSLLRVAVRLLTRV